MYNLHLHSLVQPPSLEVHFLCLALHSGGFRFPPQVKREFFLTVSTHL